MIRKPGWLAPLALLVAAPAHALCIYDGELYAGTTIPQEFADSALVIRGAAMDKRNFYAPDDAPSGAESGAKYSIRVDEVFKGDPPADLELFTEINSGRFPIHLGPEYLLFLNPVPNDYAANAAARGAWEVNYSCGQSGPWSNLSETDQAGPARLSGGGD